MGRKPPEADPSFPHQGLTAESRAPVAWQALGVVTLLSLSGLAAELLSGEVGGPGSMVTGRPPGSVSREAAGRLGGAAAQASGAPTRPRLPAATWAGGPIGPGGWGEARG